MSEKNTLEKILWGLALVLVAAIVPIIGGYTINSIGLFISIFSKAFVLLATMFVFLLVCFYIGKDFLELVD